MANYATLKAAIQDVVKTNGNNEITGALLQQSLLAMINSLGVGYQYMGFATLTPTQTNPGTPDQNVFYFASEPGIYSNFNNLVVGDNEVCIFKYNGTWTKETTGAASDEFVTALNKETKGYNLINLINSQTIEFERGYINNSTGANASVSSRLRTKNAFKTKDCKIYVPEGFFIERAFYYSAWESATNYSFINSVGVGGRFFEANTQYDLVRFTIGKTNNAAIVVGDFLNALPTMVPITADINERIGKLDIDCNSVSKSGILSTTADMTISVPGKFKAGEKLYISVRNTGTVNRVFQVYQDSTSIGTIANNTTDKEITLPNDSVTLKLYMPLQGVKLAGDCVFVVRGVNNYLTGLVPVLQTKSVVFDKINGALSEQVVTPVSASSGQYIRFDGALISGNYQITQPITLPKNTIFDFFARGAAGAVSVLSRVLNGQYIPLVIADETKLKEYKYQNDSGESINVVICSTHLQDGAIYDGGKIGQIGDLSKLETLKKTTLVDAINEVNDKLPASVPTLFDGGDIGIFAKGVCIGDSLTAGTFNYMDGGTTHYIDIVKYAYPTQLAQMLGVQVDNLGIGGATSASWYAAKQNEQISGYDFAIIQLGVNDALQNDGWTTASETAFTNIINKLKSENNKIKIFVSTIIPATSYSGQKFNDVSQGIRDLVASLNDPNVILLDMAIYGNTGSETAYNCGHLSAYGYWRLAKDYFNYISWYINNNKMVFREVQFIGTDMSYT